MVREKPHAAKKATPSRSKKAATEARSGGATRKQNGTRKTKETSEAQWAAALSPPAKEKGMPDLAVWKANVESQGWLPQHTNRAVVTAIGVAFDRLDLAGTSDVNELILRHGTMTTSNLKSARQPTLFQRQARRRREGVNGKEHRKTVSASSSPPVFLLDRYLFNFVRAVVHPLHNFLQCHHGLHNADEVQVMLMPKDGPIALADRCADLSSPSTREGNPVTSDLHRRCYVATNNETLTEQSLHAAVDGWGVTGVFQISEFVLVSGAKGQHAEQKLLTHLQTHIIPLSSELNSSNMPLVAEEKVLIMGERLPCAACRLFAVAYEPLAVLLPTHGHMYLSTIPGSAAAIWSSSGVHEKDKKAIYEAYGNPALAAKLLCSAKHQRVLH